MRPVRVGVIGAGAAAEGIHLPALARVGGVETVAIVDPSAERVEHLQRRFGVPAGYRDYRDAMPHIDAAILGIPHQYHAPVTIDLLGAGIHVLVEKPMALTTTDCEAMIQASGRSGARLAVGLLRRFAPTLRYTKELLESGMLGSIRSFDVREGMVFRWPVKSAAMLSPPCGGVLADIGVHILDLLLWWFGDVAAFQYWDDAAGGVEADAVLTLEMAGGISGRVELSRTRDLRNSCIIRGERGTLEVGTKTDSTVTLEATHGQVSLSGRATLPGQQPPGNLADLFAWQMADFVRAIETGTEPAVPGSEARRSVAVLEACYRRRQRLRFPFESLLADAAATAKAS
ncbi:MAG: Gfo/Idh/MocA family protein [Vicinamibacterales bacterium]